MGSSDPLLSWFVLSRTSQGGEGRGGGVWPCSPALSPDAPQVSSPRLCVPRWHHQGLVRFEWQVNQSLLPTTRPASVVLPWLPSEEVQPPGHVKIQRDSIRTLSPTPGPAPPPFFLKKMGKGVPPSVSCTIDHTFPFSR